MPKKASKKEEDATAEVDDGPHVKERLHLTRVEYTTMLYQVNSALNSFAYPDPSLLEHS